MGLATIDPHTQKEHAEIPKIPKLGVNQASFDWDRAFENEKNHKEMYGNADKSGHKSGFVRISIHFFVIFFSFLNACISVKTSLINTKLGDFGNLDVLFLTMGINSC